MSSPRCVSFRAILVRSCSSAMRSRTRSILVDDCRGHRLVAHTLAQQRGVGGEPLLLRRRRTATLRRASPPRRNGPRPCACRSDGQSLRRLGSSWPPESCDGTCDSGVLPLVCMVEPGRTVETERRPPASTGIEAVSPLQQGTTPGHRPRTARAPAPRYTRSIGRRTGIVPSRPHSSSRSDSNVNVNQRKCNAGNLIAFERDGTLECPSQRSCPVQARKNCVRRPAQSATRTIYGVPLQRLAGRETETRNIPRSSSNQWSSSGGSDVKRILITRSIRSFFVVAWWLTALAALAGTRLAHPVSAPGQVYTITNEAAATVWPIFDRAANGHLSPRRLRRIGRQGHRQRTRIAGSDHPK